MSNDILTTRQENFCLNVFRGLTQRESWIQAGYSSNYPVATIDKNACTLAAKGKIKGRIAELRAAAQDDTVADVLERKHILTEHARAQLVDFVSDKGEVVLSKDIPHHRAASEFTTLTTYDQEGNPKVKKTLKLRDPVAAIAELNKMEMVGTLRESVNQSINVVFVIGKGYSAGAPELGVDKQGAIDVDNSNKE